MRGILLAVVVACGGPHPTGDDYPPPDSPVGGDGAPLTLRERQRQLAMDLRGSGNFMIGVGNDNSGPYTDGVPMDVHYAYLDGYGDQNGWPTWNANGDYPLYFIQTDTMHSVTSMFTYYQLALELETNNDAVFSDMTRMNQYLSDMRLLMQRIGDGGRRRRCRSSPTSSAT